ncbi:MAG TPA: LLM class flavin-dependent oxidoreductase [Candidatus Methylomirabilis sp.]|nr:LLM class flavin-dependent oxidoreductase [Candidatus Methylomirabilis sp.]
MKFGLLSQLQVPKPWTDETERNVYWRNLDQAVAAEDAGFSHFWLTEQHFFAEIGHSASPEMFLAALSQRTRRIRLGFAVILMQCHNPFMIAERVATLDILSNGRCEFGAGRGTAAYMVEGLGFNADATYSREIQREALEAVVRMLEEEHFPGYKGAHFDLPPRQVVPRPIQRPHPPLWYAASNLETFERAGAAGVGVLGVTRYTPAEIAPHVKAYRAAIASADPQRCIGRFVNNHVGVFAVGCVHDDDRVGRELGCSAARFYYGDNDAELNHIRFGSSEGVARIKARMAGYSNDELLEAGMAIGGDADRVSRQVERWAATGIDQMIFMFQVGRTTHEQIMRAIEIVGEKVIPRFRD